MEKSWQTKWYEEIDSTNNEVERLLSEGLEGRFDILSVFAAKWQTAGKGQGDHKWHSAPGENLTFTVLEQFEDGELIAHDQPRISWGTALAVVDYLASKGVQAKIKLPNDIYVGDKKICGLLIKLKVRTNHVRDAIIGIGLDINETDFPADLPNPISLRIAVAQAQGIAPADVPEYDIHQELEIFLSYLSKRLDLSLPLLDIENEFNNTLR